MMQAEMDYFFWRDEILQVMYWMRGEQLQDQIGAADLEVFMNTSAHTLQPHIERMVEDGYLVRVEGMKGRFMLSVFGAKEGGRAFAADFAEMIKPAHAECPPN